MAEGGRCMIHAMGGTITYCVDKNKIYNKFYQLDGKINTLIDILSTFDLTNVSLSEASEKFLSSLKKEAFDDEN